MEGNFTVRKVFTLTGGYPAVTIPKEYYEALGRSEYLLVKLTDDEKGYHLIIKPISDE